MAPMVVDFHTGVADKLGYTCRLVRKAWRAGHSVVITGSAEQLGQLDALLWTFETAEFLPHARLRAGQAVAPRLAHTPIWLVDVAGDAPGGAVGDAAAGAPSKVLINLGPDAVPDVARFARLIEVVADAPDDIAQGRQRWRAHVAAGITPTNHKPSQA